MQTSNYHIRVQATASALINMVVNPVITWLLNREMQPAALGSVLADMAVTCLVMSTAIALFVSPGARRAIRIGALRVDEEASGAGLLARLPAQPAMLGIVLGAGCAALLVPLTTLGFALLGWSGIPFRGLIVFKILYTGAMAFVVTRWIIQRQLEAARQLPVSPRDRA